MAKGSGRAELGFNGAPYLVFDEPNISITNIPQEVPDEPWWYRKCTHPEFAVEAWTVHLEAEQVAVIYLDVAARRSVFHVIVAYQAWTSCTRMATDYFLSLDNNQIMEHVRLEIKFLKAQYE